MTDHVQPVVSDILDQAERVEPSPSSSIRIAVTGPAKYILINYLVGETIFPRLIQQKVRIELRHGSQGKIEFVDQGHPAVVHSSFELKDCSDLKLAQRASYLQTAIESAVEMFLSFPGLHAMVIDYPFRNPFPGIPVIFTGDEDSSKADVTFSTACDPEDSEIIDVSTTTGMCQGLELRRALACRLAGLDEECAHYADRVTEQVLKKAVQDALKQRSEAHFAGSDVPAVLPLASNEGQTTEAVSSEHLRPDPCTDGACPSSPLFPDSTTSELPWQPKSCSWAPHQSDWTPKESSWQPKACGWAPRQSDWTPKDTSWQPHSPNWRPKESDWRPRESDWRPPEEHWRPADDSSQA